jgi:hypothetical protein
MIEEIINGVCIICYEDINLYKVIKTICNHIYHDKCLNKWLEDGNSCPSCRFVIREPDIVQSSYIQQIIYTTPILNIQQISTERLPLIRRIRRDCGNPTSQLVLYLLLFINIFGLSAAISTLVFFFDNHNMDSFNYKITIYIAIVSTSILSIIMIGWYLFLKCIQY